MLPVLNNQRWNGSRFMHELSTREECGQGYGDGSCRVPLLCEPCVSEESPKPGTAHSVVLQN